MSKTRVNTETGVIEVQETFAEKLFDVWKPKED